MTKEEAIKYLQQIYQNGGHCWLDEQRIEAIDMAVNSLQKEQMQLTWQDIQRILDAADQLAVDYGSEKLNEIGYEDYCKEVLERYVKQSEIH